MRTRILHSRRILAPASLLVVVVLATACGASNASSSVDVAEEPTAAAADGGDENVFVEPAGCVGDSYDAAFEQFALFEHFDNELDQLTDAFEADPRIVDLNARWASCMFDRGYGYTNYDDARSDISRRYNAIVATELGAALPSDSDGEPIIALGRPAFSPDVQAKVDELGLEEVEVAIATWDCEQPLRATYDEVRLEYERNWVEQYGDAVRAATTNG